MPEQFDDLAGLDRVVELYRVFRHDGEPMESAWLWACRITACLESLRFEESVRADLDSLVTL